VELIVTAHAVSDALVRVMIAHLDDRRRRCSCGAFKFRSGCYDWDYV
jgi:hypothetical protein